MTPPDARCATHPYAMTFQQVNASGRLVIVCRVCGVTAWTQPDALPIAGLDDRTPEERHAEAWELANNALVTGESVYREVAVSMYGTDVHGKVHADITRLFARGDEQNARLDALAGESAA